MEFVAMLFMIMFSFNMYAAVDSIDPCENEIVDIYYPPDKKQFAYDKDCYFTKTQRPCFNCSIRWINRAHYDRFKKSFTELGMKPPFPKRTDTDRVFKPVKLY